MASQAPTCLFLLLVSLVVLVGGQRRRERRPSVHPDDLGMSVDGGYRPHYMDDSHPQSFNAGFDWTGPSWNSQSDWGFKVPRVEPREYIEEPGRREEGRRLQTVDRRREEEGEERRFRTQERRREEEDKVGQYAQRRNLIGRRRRPHRIQTQERVTVRQEDDFVSPSNQEVVRPLSLNREPVREPVRVPQVRKEGEGKWDTGPMGDREHPGSISLGLFGDGDIGSSNAISPSTQPPRAYVNTERYPALRKPAFKQKPGRFLEDRPDEHTEGTGLLFQQNRPSGFQEDRLEGFQQGRPEGFQLRPEVFYNKPEEFQDEMMEGFPHKRPKEFQNRPDGFLEDRLEEYQQVKSEGPIEYQHDREIGFHPDGPIGFPAERPGRFQPDLPVRFQSETIKGFQEQHQEGFRPDRSEGFRPEHSEGFRLEHPEGLQPDRSEGFRPERPEGFRQDRPGEFQTNRRIGFQAEKPQDTEGIEIVTKSQVWGSPSPAASRNQFLQPSRDFQMRPTLEPRNKIRPQRWKPQTVRPIIGSPFFQLEVEDQQDEKENVLEERMDSVRPLKTPRWEVDTNEKLPPPNLELDTVDEPERRKDTVTTPQFSPSVAMEDLSTRPSIKTSSKAPSIFLPTLNPFDNYQKPPFEPTQISVLEYESSTSSGLRLDLRTTLSTTPPTTKALFSPSTTMALFSPSTKKPFISSTSRTPFPISSTHDVYSSSTSRALFPSSTTSALSSSPTTRALFHPSTTQDLFSSPTMRALFTTAKPSEIWTTSYISRAKNSERNADRAFHAAKMEEEKEEIIEKTYKVKIEEKDENEEKEIDVLINRELFAKGRNRVSTKAPFVRKPAFNLEEKDIEEIDTYTSIPMESDSEIITNVSPENAYSKTHIGRLKTKPRMTAVPPVVSNDMIQDVNDENHIKDNIELGKGLQEDNDNYAKSHIRLLKSKNNGNKDYSKMTFKTIRAVIPVPKLKRLLTRNGYEISDIFNKNVKALEIVDKAMRSKSYLDEQTMEDIITDEKPVSKDEYVRKEESVSEDKSIRIPWPQVKKNKQMTQEKVEETKREDSPRRIDWKKEKTNTKVFTTKNHSAKDSSVQRAKTVVDIDAEIEAEAATMDVKSLMKKISPMSLSEVLQEVGFTLPDVMRGSKEAIKKVLRYHRQITQTEPIKEQEEILESMEEEEVETKKAESTEDKDDPYEGLSLEFKPWSPTLMEDKEDKEDEEEKKEVKVGEEDATKQNFITKKKKSGVSSLNLFKNFRKFNKKTVKSTTTTTTTTPSSSTFRFGARTTERGMDKDKFLPTQRSIPTQRSSTTQRSMKNRKRITGILSNFRFGPSGDKNESKENDKTEDKKEVKEKEEDTKNEEVTESTDDDSFPTTAPYDASLNITLTNLNMTANDVIEKKNLTVPGIDTIFRGITKDKAEVIYGEKRDLKKKETESGRGRPKKKYIQTPLGGGGSHGHRQGYGGGGSTWGGGGGRLITNRKTSTTTRTPMTYFGGLGDTVGGDTAGLWSYDDASELDREIETSIVDYEEEYYYYEEYGYEPHEVPAGVKSALIASSVVGGLAVSIFLCIFMFCLWKQMKSKLRMSIEYDEGHQRGFLDGVCLKKPKAGTKKDNSGYFNKTPPIEQHYSTTSSEEY